MKSGFYFGKQRIFYLLPFILLLIISGCKKKKEPSPESGGLTQAEKDQIALLSQTWTMSSKQSMVTLDGQDISSQFPNFTLTVTSDFRHSTTGRSTTFSVWPASGTWEFAKNSDGTSDISRIIRSDGIEVSIDLVNSTSIILSFSYLTASASLDGSNSGRLEGIEGSYIFSLEK